jgi:hypothetical protein
MGIGMSAAHDFQLAPIHAHLNLVGFVALSIFGLTYKAYPALARSRLAAASRALEWSARLCSPSASISPWCSSSRRALSWAR